MQLANGREKFMETLVDGDLAANNGGWQWSHSGMDPKPLRIFNPYTQAKKFDPICEYIKYWIPELSKVSNSELLNGEISNLEKIIIQALLSITTYNKDYLNHFMLKFEFPLYNSLKLYLNFLLHKLALHKKFQETLED